MQLRRNQNIFDTPSEALNAMKKNVVSTDGEIITSRYNGGSYLGALHIEGDVRKWNVWKNFDCIGEASLPNNFVFNFNVKHYDPITNTIPNEKNGTYNSAAELQFTPVINDGCLTVKSGNYILLKNTRSYLNRDSSNRDLTVVSKARTTSTDGSLLANRDNSGYNWMYRQYTNRLTMHGTEEFGSIAITDNSKPSILSATLKNGNTIVTYKNYTENTHSSANFPYYGSNSPSKASLFRGFADGSTTEYWTGDFYWIFVATRVLSDEEINQVIMYNESI